MCECGTIREMPSAWVEWIVGLLMRGATHQEVVSRIVDKGVNKALAVRALEELHANPLLSILVRQTEAKAKMESLLHVLANLKVDREGEEGVRRQEARECSDFLGDYLFSSRPVVLTGLLAGIMETDQWTPTRIAEQYGDSQVDVSMGLRWKVVPPYCVPCRHERMSIRAIVAAQKELPLGDDSLYITGEDRFFANDCVSELFNAALFEWEFLDRERASPDTVKLWMGPAHTHTPLHHDRANILFAQVHGRKRFTLCPPEVLPLMRNDFGCYSPLSFEKDHQNNFGVERIPHFTVELAPGEALFIPTGWWHEVLALEESISITYDNFKVPSIEAVSWTGVYWIRHCEALETSPVT